MKEVKLKLYGLGINNNYQAKVFIYDSYNNLIYEGYTYNGYLIISLNINQRYKLVASSLNEYINTYFYINDNYEYIFFFKRSLLNTNNNITLILTDYYYDNLPISKGELILWQR